MEFVAIPILEALLLALASSIDALTAGFSCGVEKVKIPLRSLFIIAGICSSTLTASLWLGNLLAPVFSAGLAQGLGAGILVLLGVYKLFDSLVKGWIRRKEREFHFRILHMRCILKIYADPAKADWDSSRKLSPGEAAALAATLSVDGLAAGFGAGLGMGNPLLAGILSLACSAAAVFLGSRMGLSLSAHFRSGGEWISGIALILLGISKCFI
jgi:putative sporulation protein YtaF